MLKQRIMTALIIAPVFAWVTVWADRIVFIAFWALVSALAAWEWCRLIQWQGEKGGRGVLFTVITTILGVASVSLSLSIEPLYGHFAVSSVVVGLSAGLWLIFVPLWLRSYAKYGELPLPPTALAVLGCALIVAFLLSMMICRQQLGGAGLLGLFVLVWCADIGAYFIGRRFGHRALAPHISPKKTREGFVGGWSIAMLVAVVYYAILPHPPVSMGFFLAVSAVVFVYATVGDLFESVLKRRCGLKDSGGILPGHGGVLDRIDSWLPAMVLWAGAFMWNMVL